jgi:hypothetical protein
VTVGELIALLEREDPSHTIELEIEDGDVLYCTPLKGLSTEAEDEGWIALHGWRE